MRKEGQERSATQAFGGRRDNARSSGGGGGSRTQPPVQHRGSSGKAPSGEKVYPMPSHDRHHAGRQRERGEGGADHRGRHGLRASAPPADATASTPRSPRNRSPPNNELCLEKMSGFGQGDGGWSERVEGRRQQQLAQLSRGAMTLAAKVNGDSGKVQPLTPSAPPASRAGHHHQAVSPPRLRRFVRAEVCTGGFSNFGPRASSEVDWWQRKKRGDGGGSPTSLLSNGRKA